MDIRITGQWSHLKPTPCDFPKHVSWTQQGDGPTVFVHRSVFDSVESFLRQDVAREHGGFLIGGVIDNPQAGDKQAATAVTAAIPCPAASGSLSHLTFDHDCWDKVHRHESILSDSASIVGWFHSHPDMTLRMSPRDEFIHRHFFDQAWHVAWIMDPISGSHAFYVQRDLGFAPITNVGLVDRVAV